MRRECRESFERCEYNRNAGDPMISETFEEYQARVEREAAAVAEARIRAEERAALRKALEDEFQSGYRAGFAQGAAAKNLDRLFTFLFGVFAGFLMAAAIAEAALR